ncbi:DUF768 domain-containing protein [Mesorhizobium sp. M4B.F.Ca.ET.214.01.1.1]|nr:DUF768 domain-containing protein [Mesorhizobium sp. M4B.F.Ca.ET.214.01.1.1]TGQ54900.1 DUF768 domain-containing protein [Mesorhizobium sp. M4B.F.Ca.ET.211.01.1.1]TGU28300.1 DUF768 domain-containing protein [Mesorhizobium sp. M4B.F.Ca.ET.150.01.1.1]
MSTRGINFLAKWLAEHLRSQRSGVSSCFVGCHPPLLIDAGEASKAPRGRK